MYMCQDMHVCPVSCVVCVWMCVCLHVLVWVCVCVCVQVSMLQSEVEAMGDMFTRMNRQCYGKFFSSPRVEYDSTFCRNSIVHLCIRCMCTLYVCMHMYAWIYEYVRMHLWTGINACGMRTYASACLCIRLRRSASNTKTRNARTHTQTHTHTQSYTHTHTYSTSTSGT